MLTSADVAVVVVVVVEVVIGIVASLEEYCILFSLIACRVEPMTLARCHASMADAE